ncbi:MAG: hypothetical protein V4592_15835 [Bacteroidota bacterium]
MEKPFFYFEPLKLSDIVPMIAYAVITIGVFLKIFLVPAQNNINLLFLYALISQGCIWAFLYASLRNFASYMIWFLFAIVHIILYFFLKNIQAFQNWSYMHIIYLFNAIILLLVFQICRFFSFKIQHREFYFARSGKDINSGSKASITDCVITIASAMVYAALLILELTGAM